MDQGLKERLIGAVVLVALGVWLIPMLLGGAHELTDRQEPEIDLPVPVSHGNTAPIKTEVINLEAQRSPPSPAGTTRHEASPTQVRPITPPTASEKVGESAASPPSHAAPPATTAVTAPPVAESSRQGSVPSSQVSAHKLDIPAPGATGNWAVQLGSFSDQGNAQRQARRVESYGAKPRISRHRADGRAMYRVRVGPYNTRQKAEAVVAMLTTNGFVAQVVVDTGAPDR